MPFVDSETVPISSIKVNRDERQRREIDTKGLEESIRRNGLIHPIVLSDDLTLIAGERRLVACRNLGWTSIPVRFARDLNQTESLIIELEENVKRSDLTWQESVLTTHRIHLLYKEIDPKWTQYDTADAISCTQPTIAKHLRIADFLLKDDPRITAANSYIEAFNIICRRDARAEGNALEELLKGFDDDLPPPSPQQQNETSQGEAPSTATLLDPYAPQPLHRAPIDETILLQSFLSWAPSYRGPKFNFIHCDFPYGINPFSGPQGQGAHPDSYEDSPEIYFALLNCLLDNFDTISSLSSHLMFWYSDKFKKEMMQLFQEKAPFLKFSPFPLIWHKSDNAGIASDPRHFPRHIYETCLFASRSDRQVVKLVSDVYSCPTDHKHHPSCKPETMLHHFFSMIVDDYTTMLDPTCGSGTSLRAAERLDCERALGLEIDPTYNEVARQQLKNARILRSASR